MKWKIAWAGLLLISMVWLQGCQKISEQAVVSPILKETTENNLIEDIIKKAEEQQKTEQHEIEKSALQQNLSLTKQINAQEQVYLSKELSLPEKEIKMVSPSVSGALQVKGAQLTDNYGNPVQLKEISTHGIAWFPDYINQECFHQLHNNWGINIIRLAMYTAEYDGYCTGGNKEYLKDLIRKGVEYATKEDMYVLIDWHILSDSNPFTYKEEAKEFFAEMSAEYATYQNVLYEICNEPNGQTSWAQIKTYAEEIIPVIRENDKDGIIIVGTPNWSQHVREAAANPITGYNNIMYTLHFYAATHTQALRDAMTEAVTAGLSIFVTEFGICDASGNGTIDKEQAERWIDAMNTCNISYIAWNLSNKNETSAILRSDCQKTYGFTEDDFSDSGQWFFSEIQGKTTEGNSFSEKTGLSYEIVQRNCWEADGKNFYQFEIILKNNSEESWESWEIAIPFNQNITLSDGWNGNYSVNNTILHITSKEYNGMIPSNGEVGNIGFIVSGSGELKPEK